MKTISSKLAVTLGAAALLIACQGNPLPDVEQSTDIVTFTPQIISRVSGDVFDRGDKILVESNDVSATYSYSDGQFSSDNPFSADGIATTYLAIYPELKEEIATQFTFSALNDQQNYENYESSDLLVAKSTSTSNFVELKFSHVMSNIELSVVSQDGTPLPSADVKFNLATEVDVDITNDSYSQASGTTKTSVLPYAIGNIYNVVAAPQEIGANELIATISYNGSEDFEWRFDQVNTIKSGYKYKYTATLDVDASGDVTGVKITFNGLINDWSKGEWGANSDGNDGSTSDKTPVLGEDYTLSEGVTITPETLMEVHELAFVDGEKRIYFDDWTMGDGLVLSGAQGAHSTLSPCLWNGTHIDIRIYSGNTFTISNPSKKIAKIELDTTHIYLEADGFSGKVWSGYSDSVTFKTIDGEASYLEGITVYYAEDIIK